MTSKLLALERNPSDKEPMDDMFRHAHSIKGMAASMGYEAIQVLSHTLEDVMDIFRQDIAMITPEAVDELLTARDAINQMVDEVEKEDEPVFKIGEKAMEYAVLDWEGVERDGKPVQYSSELLDYLPGAVIQEFTDVLLDGLDSKKAEAVEKN